MAIFSAYHPIYMGAARPSGVSGVVLLIREYLYYADTAVRETLVFHMDQDW